MNITADVVVGLQAGDEAKGKVTYQLLQQKSYDYCIRFNGSANAGHTIYHNGKKFVTHQIPTGVFFGVKSIIGSGCVVDSQALYKEIEDLEKEGVKVRGNLFVSKEAHIIHEKHRKEDATGSNVGSTKKGVGPAYKDKVGRTGIRADQIIQKDMLIDLYEELYSDDREKEVLFEGAQGYNLDVDWGDYPYVTSSVCTTAGAIQNGVPHSCIRRVYGVAKCYETYVGAKEFQPDDPVFVQIANIGQEIGSTTGRRRQCNWMDLTKLKKAVIMNGVTHLVVNKLDVMREVGKWACYSKGIRFTYADEVSFKLTIIKEFDKIVERTMFSDNPKEVRGLLI